MIFRNSIRLLFANFSNVWKLLVYYLICITLTICVCGAIAYPIIEKLAEANVFQDLVTLLNSVFYKPSGVVSTFGEIVKTAWDVIVANIQFKFNYIFLIVWLLFVFPFTLNLAQLALCEVMYGFMTSQVKYSFTGRYIKNIGRSSIYALSSYFVELLFNAVIIAIIYFIVKIYSLGSIFYILADVALFAVLIIFISFKHTFFCCFMPAYAVLGCGIFKALKTNFKTTPYRFSKLFSNIFTMVICAISINVIGASSTFGVSLIVTLPMTAVLFVVMKMVCYFSCQGMRFYVYPDMFVKPKKFEEKDTTKKLKFVL